MLTEDMVRLIYQNDDGSFAFYIQNSVFSLQKQYRRQGIGSRSFCIEVTAAASIGYFEYIETHAIGDYAAMTAKDQDNVYSGPYAWARLGFDADIPPDVLRHCDGELSGKKKVHELMESKRGREVWAMHATSLWLEFDLDQAGASWKTLNGYMQEKGIRVTP